MQNRPTPSGRTKCQTLQKLPFAPFVNSQGSRQSVRSASSRSAFNGRLSGAPFAGINNGGSVTRRAVTQGCTSARWGHKHPQSLLLWTKLRWMILLRPPAPAETFGGRGRGGSGDRCRNQVYLQARGISRWAKTREESAAPTQTDPVNYARTAQSKERKWETEKKPQLSLRSDMTLMQTLFFFFFLFFDWRRWRIKKKKWNK